MKYAYQLKITISFDVVGAETLPDDAYEYFSTQLAEQIKLASKRSLHMTGDVVYWAYDEAERRVREKFKDTFIGEIFLANIDIQTHQ